MVEDSRIIVPFLKWAGGKRWLVDKCRSVFPKNYSRYYEPFLGSGAVFFDIQPTSATISDINTDLVDTYLAIRDNWALVYRYLRRHHADHNKSHYYATRDISLIHSKYAKAARFIYLNRTCWNGLYRVNQKGEFNVPIGTKSSVVYDTDNFKKLAALLKRATIKCADFGDAISAASRNDFIFCDPPYTVRHNKNGFIKYNEKIFSWADQERLHADLINADTQGALFLCTNAAHESIKNLYKKDFYIYEIERSSVLAADSRYRGKTSEYLISNYSFSSVIDRRAYKTLFNRVSV